MLSGLIAVCVLLSFIAYIMFCFWAVGKYYYDRTPGADAAVAALLTLALILIPVVFVIGMSVG